MRGSFPAAATFSTLAAGAACIAAIAIVGVRIRVVAALIAVGAGGIRVAVGAVSPFGHTKTAAAMAAGKEPVALAKLGLRLILLQISGTGHGRRRHGNGKSEDAEGYNNLIHDFPPHVWTLRHLLYLSNGPAHPESPCPRAVNHTFRSGAFGSPARRRRPDTSERCPGATSRRARGDGRAPAASRRSSASGSR